MKSFCITLVAVLLTSFLAADAEAGPLRRVAKGARRVAKAAGKVALTPVRIVRGACGSGSCN